MIRQNWFVKLLILSLIAAIILILLNKNSAKPKIANQTQLDLSSAQAVITTADHDKTFELKVGDEMILYARDKNDVKVSLTDNPTGIIQMIGQPRDDESIWKALKPGQTSLIKKNCFELIPCSWFSSTTKWSIRVTQ